MKEQGYDISKSVELPEAEYYVVHTMDKDKK